MESLLKVSDVYQVSEIELIYRSRVKASERPKIRTAKDAYQVLMNAWNLDRIDFIEEFKIILLNRGSRVLGVYEVSQGGITGTVADKRLIFAAALKANSCGVILCHNHPSGQLIASQADKQLTQTIRDAGFILDIEVVDHLIVTSEGFFSFADEGLL